MHNFFVSQMDYIFFVYGLSFICLAATSFFMYRARPQLTYWKWFALFGIFHGIAEWLDMLVFSMGDGFLFKLIRILFLTLSFLCFVEIARAEAQKRWGNILGPWVYIPLLSFTLGSGWILGGLTGVNILSRYVFGVMGGLLAISVILTSTKSDKGRTRSLVIFASLLGCYVCTQFVVPRGSFFPSSLMNQDTFFSILGFPIQLVRMVFALVLAWIVWLKYSRLRMRMFSTTENKLRFWQKVWFPLGFVMILTLGGLLTYYSGYIKDQESRRHLLDNAEIAASLINPNRIKTLTGTDQDLQNENYNRIREQFLNILTAQPEALYVYLFGKKDGKNIFLLDTEQSAKMKLVPLAKPGEVYPEDTEILDRIFQSGGSCVVGPETDKWGAFISGLASIQDPVTNRFVAVLGIDYDASQWSLTINRARLMPIGITLLFGILYLVFFMVYKHEEATKQGAEERELIQVKLAAQLQESQEHLDMALKSSQMGTWHWDIEKDYRFWDEQTHRLMGTDPRIFAGSYQEFSCILHLDDHQKLNDALARALKDGFYETDYRVIWPDKSIHYINSRGKVIYDDQNKAQRIIGVCWDITGQKRAENLLLESEKKYHVLFDEMVSGFAYHQLICDEKGQPVDYITLEVNKEFEKLTNGPKELVIGKRAYAAVPGLDKEWLDIFGQVALTGQPCHYVQYASNLGKWFEGSVFSGEKGFFAVTFVDITDKKKTEEERNSQMQELKIFYQASVGREERIVELKDEVERLKKELGRP
ncbi:MAG: PAS domain-containing protein [Candidatus Omnitrophica bacterium]|nr:PAS domain-containing protein [Candidatus Omnitrophota bacterium]